MSISSQNIKEMTRIGHYEILDCIGRGGMGLVYLARDTRLDRLVAVKCLRTELFEPHYRERFTREALLLAKLNHPNIVQIYDFIETPDQLALVMEYVDGQNLQIRLREHLVPMQQRMLWLTQIAQGLAIAHDSGIIHRDLKAENILINKRNDAKISDLGIAKSQDFNATITDHVAGSYASMSPEQAMGETLDFKSDLFSFGILAYQLLCGAHPFGETDNKLQLMQRIISHPPVPPTKHNPTLSPEICDLLGQLLSKNVDNRPDNTHWVANQFEKLSHLVISAPEWSNDTEMAPRQANLSKQTRTDHPVYTRSNNDFATFDTRYASTQAMRDNGLANFIEQQKASIIVAVIFILAIAGVSVWLLQPKPPQYIAVIPPKLTAEGMHESQQELVKAAVYDAIQQSVLQLDGYYLIPGSEVADIHGDNETVRKATAADELITTDIQCKVEACTIRLARLTPDTESNTSRLRVLDKRSVDVLTDNYLSVAETVQTNLGNLYLKKITNSFNDADSNEYSIVLNANQELRSTGASEPLLHKLDALSSSTKKLAVTETLYREAALDLYYETQNPAYLEKLRRFINTNPPHNSLFRLYNIHSLQVAEKDIAAAEKTITAIKEFTTSNSVLNELYAHLQMAKHDYQQAITFYEKSLDAKATANNYYNNANAYWYAGDLASAKEQLLLSLTLAPNFYKSHGSMGIIAMTEGDIQTAIASFEKAVEIKANDPTILNNLGLCYLLSKEMEKAERTFDKALSIAPKNTTFLLNKADTRNIAGDISSSRSLYQQLIEQLHNENNDNLKLRNITQAYAHLGLISKALASLKQLEKIDSQNIETLYTASLVHTLANNDASAIFYIDNTLKNGMHTIWYSFSWFDRLCEESGFVEVMAKYGERTRCSPQTD